MQKVKFHEWEIEVNKTLTRSTYATIKYSGTASCGCLTCKNYSIQKTAIYPKEIQELFDNLGIDFSKETEISHVQELPSGLHHYCGWFHFKGDFIGKDCSIPSKDKSKHSFEMTIITDTFLIGFRKASYLTQFENSENIIQIEFECKIPWKLPTEYEEISEFDLNN